MPIQRTKEVTINDKRFILGLVTARIGHWITVQMAEHKYSDLATYNQIQSFLFEPCQIYQGEPPMPMRLFDGGRFLIPDMEYDLDTLDLLYEECLKFNFTPFFEKREAALKAKKQAALSGETPATTQ